MEHIFDICVLLNRFGGNLMMLLKIIASPQLSNILDTQNKKLMKYGVSFLKYKYGFSEQELIKNNQLVPLQQAFTKFTKVKSIYENEQAINNQNGKYQMINTLAGIAVGGILSGLFLPANHYIGALSERIMFGLFSGGGLGFVSSSLSMYLAARFKYLKDFAHLKLFTYKNFSLFYSEFINLINQNIEPIKFQTLEKLLLDTQKGPIEYLKDKLSWADYKNKFINKYSLNYLLTTHPNPPRKEIIQQLTTNNKDYVKELYQLVKNTLSSLELKNICLALLKTNINFELKPYLISNLSLKKDKKLLLLFLDNELQNQNPNVNIIKIFIDQELLAPEIILKKFWQYRNKQMFKNIFPQIWDESRIYKLLDYLNPAFLRWLAVNYLITNSNPLKLNNSDQKILNKIFLLPNCPPKAAARCIELFCPQQTEKTLITPAKGHYEKRSEEGGDENFPRHQIEVTVWVEDVPAHYEDYYSYRNEDIQNVKHLIAKKPKPIREKTLKKLKIINNNLYSAIIKK